MKTLMSVVIVFSFLLGVAPARGVVVTDTTNVRADAVADFHLAVAKGEIDNLREALAKDTGLVNRRDERDFTPLFQAAIRGHTAIAKLLLDRGAKVDDTVLGETPLFRACFQGHAETAGLLLDRKASIDSMNKEGLTLLFIAVQRNHKDTVRLLLDRGADPNVKAELVRRYDVVHIPLLEIAETVSGSFYWKVQFEKKGDKAQASRQERQLKDAEVIAKMLIACKKTDLNVKHPSGGAALHRIAWSGHVELAKLLLAHGAEVDVRTNRSQRRSSPPHNETPLHIAVGKGHAEMVALLVKHGANKNAQNNRGQTPFEVRMDDHADWVISKDGKLALRVWVRTTPVKKSEPIVLMAELLNKSDEPVAVIKPFGDWYAARATLVQLRGPKGPLKYTGPIADYTLGTSAFVTLAPGQSVQDTLELKVDTFAGSDAVGRYAVVFNYAYDGGWDAPAEKGGFKNVWRGSIRSKEVTVEKSTEAKPSDQPSIVFDNRPESGMPREALAQMIAKLSVPKGALPAQELPKTLHALTNGTIKTVRIRYFNKDTWATEEQAREYVAKFLAHKSLDAYLGSYPWSQGVGAPEIECLVDFTDEYRKKLRDEQKPSHEGRLLLWNTESCFRDATGRWWFVSAYDHFHGSHPKGIRENAKGAKSK